MFCTELLQGQEILAAAFERIKIISTRAAAMEEKRDAATTKYKEEITIVERLWDLLTKKWLV